MGVGVYVDGFNVDFSARDHCGQGTAGWRWLDIRQAVARASESRSRVRRQPLDDLDSRVGVWPAASLGDPQLEQGVDECAAEWPAVFSQ
jgi:hypothetical protein